MTDKLIQIFLILVLSSCGQSNTGIILSSVDTIISTDSLTAEKNITKKFDYLKTVKSFTEQFIPDTTIKNGFNKIQDIPDSIVIAFKALRPDRENQEKYLTLLFLKVYRGHLQCCHQSYELREKTSPSVGIDSITDPLLHEYNKITKLYDSNMPIEFISSSYAFTWTEKNKNLLKYDKIKREYKIITSILTNIEKEVYWK